MNRIRETRFFKKVNQYQLALLSGVCQSRISLLENGLVEPRWDEKQKISRALGVSMEEVFLKSNVSSIRKKFREKIEVAKGKEQKITYNRLQGE